MSPDTGVRRHDAVKFESLIADRSPLPNPNERCVNKAKGRDRLPADQHSAISTDRMDLKHVVRRVDTDGNDILLHGLNRDVA